MQQSPRCFNEPGKRVHEAPEIGGKRGRENVHVIRPSEVQQVEKNFRAGVDKPHRTESRAIQNCIRQEIVRSGASARLFELF